MRHEIEDAARWLAWSADNARRWKATAPDHVVVVVDAELPAMPARRPAWQRILPDKPSVQSLCEALDAIEHDPRVRGVVLHLRAVAWPAASLDALRAAILSARAAGKRVVAWATHYSRDAYFVACAADEILLQKGGLVGSLGRADGYVFLADALARAGVSFDAVKIAPFKTAADALSRSEMSGAAREMAEWLLDGEEEERLQAVADGRGLDREAARALLDGSPYTDLQARQAGVVDGIVSEEDLPQHLESPTGPARLERWHSARRSIVARPPELGRRHVALMRIEGLIVDGESAHPPAPVPVPLVGGGRSGDLTVTQEARLARDDDDVAALVVWIDSPGGSATACEAMASALERVAADKPVVAVMGTVAASGGYYVSTPAHWVIAQPGTLTGSIGVLAAKLVVGELLAKLGINRELLSRGRHARIWDPQRPFTAEERGYVQGWIERTYDVFVARVAAARDLDIDHVDAVAGGRVWTGRQALGHGLVDGMGGLEDAIALAREMAKLGPRAPVRPLDLGRKRVAPAPSPSPAGAGTAALARHVLDGLEALSFAPALCLPELLPSPDRRGGR